MNEKIGGKKPEGPKRKLEIVRDVPTTPPEEPEKPEENDARAMLRALRQNERYAHPGRKKKPEGHTDAKGGTPWDKDDKEK